MSDSQDPRQRAPKKAEANSAPRRPLREDVRDLDQNILRLMMRRHALLERMKRKGRLEAEEEKYLRESWQRSASRFSKDPELLGRFFVLLQEISFLPPQDPGSEEGQARQPFTLMPSHQPVQINLQGPLDTNLSRAWLYMGACAGGALALAPVPQSEGVVDFVKILVKMGCNVSRRGEHVSMPGQPPLGTPDVVLHAGSSKLNLFLALAHYLGRPSRVKITGDSELRLLDLSGAGKFLPALGARLIHLLPHSSGLPVRLEASGMLPAVASFPEDLPWQLAEALLLAAPWFSSAFALDLSSHSQRENILAHVLPILTACGAQFVQDGALLAIEPGIATIPPTPDPTMDARIGAAILGLASALGGRCALNGRWPNRPDTKSLQALLKGAGLRWQVGAALIESQRSAPLAEFPLADAPAHVIEDAAPWRPLAAGLAAAASRRKGNASFPSAWLENDTTQDFFSHVGVALQPDGRLTPAGIPASVWNAPDAEWAFALALAACGGNGTLLGNPGIITRLWPGFWALYNSLPNPRPKTPPVEQDAAKNMRRRIITSATATVPEVPENG